MQVHKRISRLIVPSVTKYPRQSAFYQIEDYSLSGEEEDVPPIWKQNKFFDKAIIKEILYK